MVHRKIKQYADNTTIKSASDNHEDSSNSQNADIAGGQSVYSEMGWSQDHDASASSRKKKCKKLENVVVNLKGQELKRL